MTEFSCPFGIAEKLLREKEYPSEPDRESFWWMKRYCFSVGFGYIFRSFL